MDITYMTQVEIDSMKSIFCSCSRCEQGNIEPSDLIEYKGEEMCDDCYLAEKLFEIGTREVVVRPCYAGGFECTDSKWDLGCLFGYGNTRDAAIEDYLENMGNRHDIDGKLIEYTIAA